MGNFDQRQPIVTLPEQYMRYDSGQRVSPYVELHLNARPQSDAAAEWMAAPPLDSNLAGAGVAGWRWVALVCYRLDSTVVWWTGPVSVGRGGGTLGGVFRGHLLAA